MCLYERRGFNALVTESKPQQLIYDIHMSCYATFISTLENDGEIWLIPQLQTCFTALAPQLMTLMRSLICLAVGTWLRVSASSLSLRW